MSRAERTDFDISPGFALAAAIIYFFDRQGIFALIVISCIVHEAGHYLVLLAFGAKPRLVRLELTGAAMYFDENRLSYAKEVLAALAGPFFGALLALSAAALHCYALAGVSAVLSAFNLIPAGGLDGGRALHAVLSALTGENKADRAVSVVTFVLSLLMLAAGLALGLYCGFGWALMSAGAALLIRQMRR